MFQKVINFEAEIFQVNVGLGCTISLIDSVETNITFYGSKSVQILSDTI